MKQDGSIDLFQYWNRLRDGRPAPKRTEIEPADIKSLLADTFILERDTRGEAVFRLAGTRLCATHGRELKGFSFPSLWREKDQRLIARFAYSVFHSKSVIVIAFEGHSAAGRSNPFELLLLPLDGGLENPRALGIVSPCEKPYWLGSDPIVEASIESVRVIDPDREPLFLRNRPSISVPPLVPSDSAFSESARAMGARRIRHLVVLKGGRDT
ncbi:PAS domain-containing protein [Pseudaminobacter soli (ex Li et al. 2025)]|uniref:PAS domain-containing protein n=1 Tax=Pseudaminobacter soli (ex Li et al. 2025) TaxID=1295366 RepID=A0A2P7SNM1_9HYPH|nr:PAS domain-containing protein [Mesorhizobium soli]PSJ64063.1 PAS domain-containing protein [Mesorhizobium soli]